MNKPPRIDNAPGLVWRPRKNGWEARWQARSDLVKRGYLPKSLRLWEGPELDEIEAIFIAERCRDLQDDMKTWGRGGIPKVFTEFDGTLKSLAGCYQTDKDSSFQQLRFATKVNYRWQCEQILATHGDERIEDIKARQVKAWHAEWLEGGKIAKAHGLIGMLRTLVSFGATLLECDECSRLSGVLSQMRFTMPKARTERLTAEHAVAIRAKAHEMKKPSIALVQAIQFECMLRQKDVIGEWVPIHEPGALSEILSGNRRWLAGIRWNEIDENLVLRHVTSKRQKPIEIDLRQAPMVMEELAILYGQGFTRADLPASGAVIISEETNLPYRKYRFNPIWRGIADAAGVPKHVYNMDSRAGAISEATDAGADLEHVRHAATHSNIQTTQRYSRGGTEKTLVVMQKRTEYRNKTRT